MPNETITLTEAAERLGVHYMTAYRYVRTGRLPATKLGSEWRVETSDVDAMRTGEAGAAAVGGPPAAGPGGAAGPWPAPRARRRAAPSRPVRWQTRSRHAQECRRRVSAAKVRAVRAAARRI